MIQGIQVRSLTGELRSHKPQAMAKKKKKDKKKEEEKEEEELDIRLRKTIVICNTSVLQPRSS